LLADDCLPLLAGALHGIVPAAAASANACQVPVAALVSRAFETPCPAQAASGCMSHVAVQHDEAFPARAAPPAGNRQ
jgi:hypothetical protein